MRQTPNEKNRPVRAARAADLKNRGEKTALAPANERAALAWLGLAWLGLAWLGLAWLGLAWLGLAKMIAMSLDFLCDLANVLAES
jgi:hypothetical protein